MARWARARDRGAPRRHAAAVQGDHRGAVRAGLVKAVFATETLALGINMPARSVVLERLVKYNGETHVELTAGEYTQLTGRAGRRGIDVEGHAVVLWTPGFDPEQVAGLASTRTYPLRSSFRPSYNMAVNLVASMGREAARILLESSFAQFQADRAVVGLARQVHRHDEAIAGYEEAMHCERGSAAEYAALRRQLSRRETELSRERSSQRRSLAGDSLRKLRTGDVIRVPGGRRVGLAVVLSEGAAVPETGRLVVLMADRQVKKLTVGDFPTPVEALARVRVGPQLQSAFAAVTPRPRLVTARARSRRGATSPRRPRPGRESRRWLRSGGPMARSPGCAASCGRTIRSTTVPSASSTCGGPSGPIGSAGRAAGLKQRVEGRTNTIARTFDRVCSLLEERGYLTPEQHPGPAPPTTRSGIRGGDSGRTAAGPDLYRVGPAGRRVSSARRLGRTAAAGVGRGRFGAGVRVTHRRVPRADASRRARGSRGPRGDGRRYVTSSRRPRRRIGSISCRG